MNKGRLLAIIIAAVTVALIVVGTVWPVPSAKAMAGSGASLLRSSSSPQAAVENLAAEIGRQAWGDAYSSLANRSEFTETEFVRDLTGSYPSLRTYATLDSFDPGPCMHPPTKPRFSSNCGGRPSLERFWKPATCEWFEPGTAGAYGGPS